MEHIEDIRMIDRLVAISDVLVDDWIVLYWEYSRTCDIPYDRDLRDEVDGYTPEWGTSCRRIRNSWCSDTRPHRDPSESTTATPSFEIAGIGVKIYSRSSTDIGCTHRYPSSILTPGIARYRTELCGTSPYSSRTVDPRERGDPMRKCDPSDIAEPKRSRERPISSDLSTPDIKNNLTRISTAGKARSTIAAPAIVQWEYPPESNGWIGESKNSSSNQTSENQNEEYFAFHRVLYIVAYNICASLQKSKKITSQNRNPLYCINIVLICLFLIYPSTVSI